MREEKNSLSSGKVNVSLRASNGMTLLHFFSFVKDSERFQKYRLFSAEEDTVAPSTGLTTPFSALSSSSSPSSLATSAHSSVPLPRPSPSLSSKHTFRSHTVRTLTPCEACRKLIVKECVRCLHCKQIVHEKCTQSLHPFCLAADSPLFSLLVELINLGAKPLSRDRLGYLPLHYACHTGNAMVVDFYIRKLGIHPDVRSILGTL